MRVRLSIVVVCILAMALPAPASADGKKIAGASLMLGGAGLAAAAFNWRKSCPEGYSTHTFEGLDTQCVYISSFGSDVRTADTKVNFARPALAWAGGGAALLGFVLLMWPNRAATPSINISVSPAGLRAGKTIRF